MQPHPPHVFVGDLLTLADEAPTRFQRARLLWEASSALVQMQRFLVARSVLEELLLVEPENREAQTQYGLVLAQPAGDGGQSAPRFAKVVVFSGHMTDLPDRAAPRFPESKTAAVAARIGERLDAWQVGAGDLAICGGARGGDILFAEGCAERGAEVWLFLPLPENDFLDASVRHTEADWEGRYFALRDRDGVSVFSQVEHLKSPPEGASVYARNNLWMINTARVEADDPSRLHAVLVWDEQPSGDGPGGTSDFAARVRKLGGRLAPVINPTKL